jgi:alpha-N-arabinofuranosidase
MALLLVLGPARSGRAQSPPVATSSITVDFQKVKRVIPALLFGQNLQPIERGEGIVKPDGSFDREIVALLQEARITTLRFPGGTAADFFHWWQALGPHSRRPKLSSGYLGEFYSPLVGPDEFIKLATALRAVPFVTANTGTGSAEEAAAFARFFESRGFPAVYWEVGNEVYFEGLSDSGQIGLPPDVYARRVIEYAVAIRKVAPYAKIFSAAVIGPEEQDSFWNSVVLGLAGPYVDGISVHNAYFPLYAYRPDRTIPPDEELFTSMLGATKAVERSMTVLEGQLKRLGKLIPIFVTEYDGIFFPDKTVEDPVRTHQRNPTLASALFNASVLHVMARHERVYGAHHMSLAGAHFGSLIGTAGAVRFRNPQFYVHREYARESGNLMTDVQVDPKDALFDSKPVKLLSGQTGVPMLDALATRDPGGESYALFVVNRSLTTAVDAPVTLNLPAGVSATVSVLNGPGPGSRNSAESPENVALTTKSYAASNSFTYRFPAHSLTIFRFYR